LALSHHPVQATEYADRAQEFQAALGQEAEKAVEYAIANACRNGSRRSVDFVLTDFNVVVSQSAAMSIGRRIMPDC
jgi:hypothetical protein